MAGFLSSRARSMIAAAPIDRGIFAATADGAPTFNGALRTLRFGGRLVVVGNVTTERVEINPGYLIARELAVIGSASATRAELSEVLGWLSDGKLTPIIAARRPLAEARAAQAALKEKEVVGRQLLIP